jgi:hypothetical protein
VIASRFALVGLTLATIFLGYFPAPDPFSGVEPRPIPSPGQTSQDTSARQPRAAANELLLPDSDVALVEQGLEKACWAVHLRRVPVEAWPEREAESVVQTAHIPLDEETGGQLPRAEAGLVRLLATRRESSSREARPTRSQLRQPYLEELILLAPLASLDELGELVSYRRKRDLDQVQVAAAEQRRTDFLPGLIVPVSHDSDLPDSHDADLPDSLDADLRDSHGADPPARPGDAEEAGEIEVSDSVGEDRTGALRGLGAVTRCRAAIGGWIARKVRPGVQQPDPQSGR